MQEEVENRTVNLAISTGKLTGRALFRGMMMYLQHRRNKNLQKAAARDAPVRGKQSVEDLIGQGQGCSTIDVANGSAREFCKCAKKYGVDYAIMKDKNVIPPKYIVFFKAKDVDALNQVMSDYASKMMKKQSRPSVLAQLNKLKELVASIPRKVKEKIQERDR